MGCFQAIKIINKEYAAVCALIHRSGVQSRNFHSSCSKWQKPPLGEPPGGDKNKPNKNDDDNDKISSLLAKAFLWMLTAYMVIAVISLMFPSSNQPEVFFFVEWFFRFIYDCR